jgi:hypothetical protein
MCVLTAPQSGRREHLSRHGGRHPNNPFTVFIPAKSADKFSNYTDYEGKTITVSGTIAEHNKKPQIIAKDPSQITIK